MEGILHYFKEAEKILDANEFEEEDGYEIFLQNVLGELEGSEYRLACNHDGSQILEKVLRLANRMQLRVFFEKTRQRFLDMCCHRYASHVAETWIYCAAGRLLEEEEASIKEDGVYHERGTTQDSIQDDTQDGIQNDTQGLLSTLTMQLGDLAQWCIEEFVRLSEDCYGSHVLRKLMQFWCGQLEDGEGRRLVQGGRGWETQGYLRNLTEFVLSIPEQAYDLKQAVLHEQASPLLQLLLVLLCQHYTDHYERLLKRFLPIFFNAPSKGKKGASSDEEQSYGQLSESFFLQAAEHKIGSRFLESLIGTLDAGNFLLLFTKLVKTNVARLLEGPHGNFVLQCVISNCRNRNQFELVLGGVRPFAQGLVTGRRHGILLRLVQWVLEHELDGSDLVMEVIFDAFHLKNTQERKHSFDALCALQVLEALSQEESKPILAAGCSLLQLLASFPPSINKPIIDSFLDLSVSQLFRLALHPNGSRAIEAILSSRTVSDKVKQRTIRKLRDHMDRLAADKFASHIVDKCWELASSELRGRIAERLLHVKTKLLDSPHGRLVFRNCRIEDYERDARAWLKNQSSAERRRAMFADITGEGEGEGERKKQRREGEREGEGERDQKQGKQKKERKQEEKRKHNIKEEEDGFMTLNHSAASEEEFGSLLPKELVPERIKSKKRPSLKTHLHSSSH